MEIHGNFTFEKLKLDMEAKDAIEYDDDGGHNGQSRKREELDSGRDENSNLLNLANAQRVEQLNQWSQVRSKELDFKQTNLPFTFKVPASTSSDAQSHLVEVYCNALISDLATSRGHHVVWQLFRLFRRVSLKSNTHLCGYFGVLRT